MSSFPESWVIETITDIRQIRLADWNLCAFPESKTQPVESEHEVPDSEPYPAESTHQEDTCNPFISYEFLSSLEESHCVGGRTGWTPAHIVVKDAAGETIAVAPCYAKSHSQGEYVFDHGWAEAYERAGGRYYPKLQVSVPFTPVTGPRLLVRAGIARAKAEAALIAGLRALGRQINASSIHITFLPEAQAQSLESQGLLIRNDRQFHWNDAGYKTFDGFLGALASRKRKAIKRERREALQSGIAIRWVTGEDITETDWDAFFAFYMDTGSRKWGRPYLNRKFFSLISERMANRILLVLAEREGRTIAGAINFIGNTTLYGRNWGAIEEHPFLHFEVCYYQAIDFALARGLTRVEAGAQGEHKLARGYSPVITYSAHDITHEGLRAAVADFVKRERAHVAEVNNELETFAPFKKTL